MKCAACGFDNPDAMRFCGNCGAGLTPTHVPAAERRQVTVMFCDLVDSTRISGQLDPEDLRELLNDYQATAHQAIEEYGGHIAQYLGDGLLVYFGFPEAHEDDARRAIHAGLEILSRIEALNERLQHLAVTIEARIGIETGAVVTGAMGVGSARETLALGQTPNVAARLESIAPPGGLVLGEHTQALVQGQFQLRGMGPQTLKGIEEPILAYQAIGPSSHTSIGGTSGNDFVGRREELEYLMSVHTDAARGAGLSVAIVGEPGVGKSRLSTEFRQNLPADDNVTWLEGACSPFAQRTPLHVFNQILRGHLQLDDSMSAAEQEAALRERLQALGVEDDTQLPFFGQLLGVPLSGTPVPEMSPELLRTRTIEALMALLIALSETQVLVLLIDDLHWSDPTTLQALAMLAPKARQHRILVLVTSRPPAETAWCDRVVALTRISDADVAVLAQAVAEAPLDEKVIELLIDRTDGIPLFVEELTREMRESGAITVRDGLAVFADNAARSEIPATLQSSLIARIDRLGEAKPIAQLGAVFGREFSSATLAKVSDVSPPVLENALAKLVDSGLVIRSEHGDDSMYSFRHALIQEAAYGLLLRTTRRTHHARIAEVIEAEFPAETERQPELLAYHHYEAGNAPQAIQYWMAAGNLAMLTSSSKEAVAHMDSAVAALDVIPESPEKNPLELQVRLTQGTVVRTAESFVSPTVLAAYGRAAELADQMGSTEMQFWSGMGLRMYYSVRGDTERTLEIDTGLLALAERSGDEVLIATARLNLATSFRFVSRFAEALELVLLAKEVAPEATGALRELLGWDHHSQCYTTAAICLWHMGRGTEAREFARLGIDRIEGIDHAFSIATGYLFLGVQFHHFLRDTDAVILYNRLLYDVSHAHGYTIWENQAIMFDSLVKAYSGDPGAREAAAQTLAMVRGKRASGDQLANGYFYAVAAESYLLAGDLDAAEDLLSEGLAWLATPYEEMWAPELHRLAGDLARKRERAADADAHYERAIDLARRQTSLGLEFRATVSLARSQQERGNTDRARMLLGDVIARVGAGHDTPDMDEAQALYRQIAA